MRGHRTATGLGAGVVAIVVGFAGAAWAAPEARGAMTVAEIQALVDGGQTRAAIDRRTRQFIARHRARRAAARQRAEIGRPIRRPLRVGRAAPRNAPPPRARPETARVQTAKALPRSAPPPRRAAAPPAIDRRSAAAPRARGAPTSPRVRRALDEIARLRAEIAAEDRAAAAGRRTARFIRRERARRAAASRRLRVPQALAALTDGAALLSRGSVLGGLKGYWGLVSLRGF